MRPPTGTASPGTNAVYGAVMSDEAITNPATRTNATARGTGQRRRCRGVGAVAGGTVYWEVDMGKGTAGDHQPATVRSSHHGGPVRDAVIAGHRGDVDAALRLSHHRDPAVRAAALGALDRIGALDASILAEAIADPDPAVRRRA